MKDIFSVDFRDAIRFIVRKELKAKYGLKIPKIGVKEKCKSTDDCQSKNKYFGSSLEKVPSKNIREDQYFAIPLFLVDAFDYLKDHLNVEGLFRKSGSTARQKGLRELIEREGTFINNDQTVFHPHDIASLVKQFFRELPNPLFTTQFSPLFHKCYNLIKTSQSNDALFLCTLLLPDEHLRVLKYLVECINEVANYSLQSKMSIRNLGIIFAPNLIYVSSKDTTNEKLSLETTEIVEYIFKNPDKIGMVPENILEKATAIHLDDGNFTSSGDEVEDNSRRGRTLEQNGERKRERSKSITKFLRRGFKSAERKPLSNIIDRDIHGVVISPQRWVKNDTAKKNEKGKYPSSSSFSSSSGTKLDTKKTTKSPIRKSPRLEKNDQPLISLPVLKTISHQIAITPRNKMQNVDRIKKDSKTHITTPVLPSKFDFSRDRNHSSTVKIRSNPIRLGSGNGDNNVHPMSLPSSRISRHTQKPHVKKSRRASSVDRRRARYQGSPGLTRIAKNPVSDDSPITPFTVENLTVNIAFIEDSKLPSDGDTWSFNSSSEQSKIPRWKSDVNQSSSTTTLKNHRNKSISNPDIKSLGTKNIKSGNSRSRVKKR